MGWRVRVREQHDRRRMVNAVVRNYDPPTGALLGTRWAICWADEGEPVVRQQHLQMACLQWISAIFLRWRGGNEFEHPDELLRSNMPAAGLTDAYCCAATG